MDKTPLNKPCATLLSLALVAAGCSSGSSDAVMTSTPEARPAAPAPGMPEPEPTSNEEAGDDQLPSSSGSTEAPPVGIDLSPPSVDTAGPAEEPSVEAPAEAGAPVPSAGCGAAEASEAVASGRFSIDVA